MKRLVAFSVTVAIIFFCIPFLNAFAAEIEIAPGIKAMDPSNTGAAVLRVPIEVPPGRNGIAPNLALSYNSSSGDGWVGMGWNLEAGAIQRSTKNGVNYNANDFIILKDDASMELVPRDDWGPNYYGAKIEGSFTKYFYNSFTGGWEVTTKDGLKYYYGTTTTSRQNNPWDNTNNNQVLKWYLDKVQDLNGNFMIFAYANDQGVTYLRIIQYTGNIGSLGLANEVVFSRNGTLLNQIDMYANGPLVRRVSLSYTTSPNTGKSLLHTITRYGSDGSSTLPVTTFSYQTNAGGFTSAVVGPALGNNIVAGDFTGDGRADIADASTVTSNNSTSVYYSQGKSFSQPVTLSTPLPSCTVCIPGGSCANEMTISNLFSGDFNGDGAADLVISGIPPVGSNCNDAYNVYYSSYSNGQLLFSQSTLPFTTSLRGDFNGDGITDFASSGQGPTLSDMTVSISRTDGTHISNVWPVSPPVNSCSYTATGDFNGDGKTDILLYGCADGYAKILYSTGTSFVVGQAATDFNSNQVVVGDFDGDGKADVAIVTGSGNYVTAYLYFAKDDFTFSAEWIVGLHPSTYGIIINKLLTADFDGDGKTDLLIIGCLNDGSGNCGSTFTDVLYSTGSIPDLLSTVNNGIGGNATFTYNPSTNYTNQFLPVVAQVVSSITVNDGNGNVSTTNYTYSGGLFRDREFRGFNYVKATAPSGTTTETWYNQDDIYKGLVSDQVIKDVSGNVYAGVHNDYQSTSPYSGVNFPHVTDKYDYLYDGVATYKEAKTSFTFDSYGNITRKYSWGDVSVNGDERDENTDYYYDTMRWLVSHPSHIYINDNTGAKKAETWFDYDTSGNLTTTTLGLVLDNKFDPTNPKITYTSYRYGNAETITDARGFPTTISYHSTDNPTYTYPVSKTNYLGQVVSAKYDERFGKPLSVTDANGNSVAYQYDAFGRSLNADNHNIDSPAYAWKETYYDGLHRGIKTRAAGPGGNVIVTETKYDDRGLVEKTSLPYFENVEQPRWTNYYYDPISRVTDVHNPDATVVSRDYMQGRTTLTDANGHQRMEYRDVYGRLVTVEEYTGDEAHANFTLYATTTYKYDVLGNLTDVYDAQNNHTQIHYDPLSRKDWMIDPDMGYWQYWYDANGNLTTQTDAKNQTIQFTYDELNRIKNKHYVNCSTCTDVNYTYDETWSTNSKGRLTTVTDASGTEKYYYDKLGRMTTIIKNVAGTNYQIDSTYDELGRSRSIRYPDGETVNYDYDAGGNLSGVPEYATFTAYNALGQAGTITYANGVTTTRQYDLTNNRLSSIITNGPLQGGVQIQLQNLSYLYDFAGNISTITDHIDVSRTQTFIYDELNRLRFATSTAYGSLEYRFNEIGNITYNSQLGSYTYWKDYYGTKPHAVYQAGPSNTYRYDDANGNMTSRNGSAILYDFDNMPSSMNGTTFVYDYSGRRVIKNGTVYVGKLYECTGGSCTKYIFAGNDRIAAKSPGSTYFYQTDHLGSSNIVTDLVGQKKEEINYYPFGNARTDTGTVNLKHKYTGQENDPETGLYYYGARYYDPVIGRFISADNTVQAPGDPQSFNRYNYARNNPLFYKDPTGHDDYYSGGDFPDNNYSGGDSSSSDAPPADTPPPSGPPPAGTLPSDTRGDFSDYDYSNNVDTIGNNAASLSNNIVGGLNTIVPGAQYLNNAMNSLMQADWGNAGYNTAASGIDLGLFFLTAGESTGVNAAGSLMWAGGEDVTTLYRAVSGTELNDIAVRGFQLKAGGYESKLFATSLDDAARFGRDLYKLDSEPFFIVQTQIKQSVARQFEWLTLDLKPAVNVPNLMLPSLNSSMTWHEITTIPLPR